MAHDTAGKQGDHLETRVRSILELEGYASIEVAIGKKNKSSIYNLMPSSYRARLNWCIAQMGEKPFYVTKTRMVGCSIYEVPWNVDIFAWHPQTFVAGLAMEIKQQSSSGSVDEKYPFVVHSLMKLSKDVGCKSILYTSGGGDRECAKEWCIKQEALANGAFYFVDSEAAFRRLIKKGSK